MTTIAVVDYGMGNLRSVAKALEHVAPRQRVVVSQSRHAIGSADRVVFPGQGAIGMCMRELERLELRQTVIDAAREKPFLGLCLGPQALLSHSEENGGTAGLGVLAGNVRKFESVRARELALKVPHMGWNRVEQSSPHPLWQGIAQSSRFYFVHSYYLVPEDRAVVAGTTDYVVSFASAIAASNIFAVQFHPEKSAQSGLRLLANFSRWNPA